MGDRPRPNGGTGSVVAAGQTGDDLEPEGLRAESLAAVAALRGVLPLVQQREGAAQGRAGLGTSIDRAEQEADTVAANGSGEPVVVTVAVEVPSGVIWSKLMPE